MNKLRIQEVLEKINETTQADDLMDELVDLVAEYVYDEDDDSIVDNVLAQIEQPILQKDFFEKIKSRIAFFVKMKVFRKEDVDTVIGWISTTFRYRYEMNEIPEYLSEQEGYSLQNAQSLFDLLSFCENRICIQGISKRRFDNSIKKDLQLDMRISDTLWNIYAENKDNMEKQVLFRYVGNLNARLNQCIALQREVRDEIDFLEYLALCSNGELSDDSLD